MLDPNEEAMVENIVDVVMEKIKYGATTEDDIRSAVRDTVEWRLGE
jgi:hypothetical protein